MTYQAKNYEHLLGTPGFSDTLLKNHFTLYQGYVTNANKLAEALAAPERRGTPEYAELKRRFGWEFNGMRLHELYFENLAKAPSGLDRNSPLARKLAASFGSFEDWEKDFRATGALRGIGWGILTHDPAGDRLFNVWVNEHDAGHLAGARPILVMDVFEHAFLTDYGLKRADYIESFFKAVDWPSAAYRLAK